MLPLGPASPAVCSLQDAYHGEKATLETHYHELARMYALTVRENTDLRNSETALVSIWLSERTAKYIVQVRHTVSALSSFMGTVSTQVTPIVCCR